jgi:hypothetical protein
MITVELTKREVGALSEATRLGDIDDLEALRTAIDKLWKAADAQEHGDTWRIIHAGNRSRHVSRTSQVTSPTLVPAIRAVGSWPSGTPAG